MCAGRWPIRLSKSVLRMAATRRSICRRRSSRATCAARSTSTSASSKAPESSRSKELFHRNARQSLQFLERKSIHCFHDVKPIGLHVDHREIRIDAVDAPRAGEGIRAVLDDLAFALLGQVLHHDKHFL